LTVLLARIHPLRPRWPPSATRPPADSEEDQAFHVILPLTGAPGLGRTPFPNFPKPFSVPFFPDFCTLRRGLSAGRRSHWLASPELHPSDLRCASKPFFDPGRVPHTPFPRTVTRVAIAFHREHPLGGLIPAAPLCNCVFPDRLRLPQFMRPFPRPTSPPPTRSVAPPPPPAAHLACFPPDAIPHLGRLTT